jgi:hypothetical protein
MCATPIGGLFMSYNAGSALESRVAEKYKKQGYEVISGPQTKDLPFNLGSYSPDLIARKSSKEGYIIELKNSVAKVSVDRYREIAEIVSQHDGWRFLLVTGDDVSSNEQEKSDDVLLSWNQMRQRKIQAEHLLSIGETEGAFLSFWVIFEAELRQQAKQVSIPIERFPTPSLINHLYSQGELSIEQFDKVKALQAIRNRFIHGYQTPNLMESAKQLQGLVSELLELWATQ